MLTYLVSFCFVCLVSADGGDKTATVGHWNLTDSGNELCVKLDAGIILDIVYKTHNGTGTKQIVSLGNESINSASKCKNASHDRFETLALTFAKDRVLSFGFTRDPNITGDQKGSKWELYQISFKFNYDPADFPDAEKPGEPGHCNNSSPLKEISSTSERSFGCSATDPLQLSGGCTVTLTSLRVQPFMTGKDYGGADWCSKEQTSDLIPIIIGAALAALVIIVLIVYLVGRARARTTTYDNI